MVDSISAHTLQCRAVFCQSLTICLRNICIHFIKINTNKWTDQPEAVDWFRHVQSWHFLGIFLGILPLVLSESWHEEMIKRDLPGYAIGGLSGGEAKHEFWRVVEQCTRPGAGLPEQKPRYLMGVGYPLDIVICVALGVDMFDCVYPCRTARFGTALVRSGQLRLTSAEIANHFRPPITC